MNWFLQYPKSGILGIHSQIRYSILYMNNINFLHATSSSMKH
ncbi:hypothetical protein [Chryseobacterium lacus]|nr:hypothetical protein [Chryseobacterium lacus]